MFPDPAPRLYALPPGADFPARLAQGLISRAAGQPPEALARVTLYLNTARMRERVRRAFLGGGACILPRLRLVTDIGADPLPGLPPPVPALRRRLDLAAMIGRLIDADPGFAPAGARMALAESLADLLDEMQGEGVPPERIAALDVSHHAEHWARTQAFMDLVARYFADDGVPDVQARQRRAVLRLLADWAAAPPADPVIVAGSTGSRGPTQALMAAVARLPQGAIVLPGYDADLPPDVWSAMSAAEGGEDHPQFRFRRLFDRLGTGPEAVRAWDGEGAPDPARNRLISLALRPAPVTDRWRADGPAMGDMRKAAAGMTLVEAPSPRAEAAVIALALRRAAEAGRRVALITPDRDLTRRVTALLDRWGIVPDDSAGEPLILSAPGRFLRHVAGLFGERLTAEALVTLLKHPLTAAGLARGAHLRLSRRLELRLRERGPAYPDAAFIRDWAAPEDAAWAVWLADLLAGLGDAGPQPLPDLALHHRRLAEALAAGPGAQGTGALWQTDAGEAARGCLDRLAAAVEPADRVTPADFRTLLDGLLAGGEVRATVEPHPAVLIQGTLEARAREAELVILGGLNDGIWPPSPAPDPWLNRRMRMDAGLRLPEQQVGLSAHDFQQAVAAPEVILTRAVRDDAAGTVPSRWLNRLTGLLAGLRGTGGPEGLQEMKDRGKAWLALAQRLDRPEAAATPARRPSPRPPAAVRPLTLAVTEVATLLHDPYAVYARRVLSLRPVRPFRDDPDARDRGILIHRILETFARGHVPGEDRKAAFARLAAATDRHLAEGAPWPAARLLWRARILRAADALFDIAARVGGVPLLVEEEGRVQVGATGVALRGRPDRIDRRPDGRLWLFDYKSGKAPVQGRQVTVDNQLLLLAAMADRGAFGAFGAGAVAGATYLGLSDSAVSPPADPGALAAVWEALERLIRRMADPATGYTARRTGQRAEADYAHLSRYGEWRLSQPAVAEDVG
jgi:double-strand break repair protein AddB